MTTNTETILASLNTHAGRGADGRPYDLEAACRQLKADIIVLQEVWRPRGGPDQVADIAAALGTELLRAELIGRTVEIPGKVLDDAQVGSSSGFGEVPTLDFLQHQAA